MSETKHTPGPWRAGKSCGAVVTDSPVSGQDDDIVDFYGGYVICESVLSSDMPVITAAPDMLAALKMASAELHLLSGSSLAAEQISNDCDDIIAKAEGRAE